jgi:hypothetical protein
MATRINYYEISTASVNGYFTIGYNQAFIGGVDSGQGIGPRYKGIIKYVPSLSGLEENVLIPQATLVGRIYIPEPLVGMNTVINHVINDESTGWTGGN